MALTVDLKAGRIVLVLPKRSSHAMADHFLLQNRDWIQEQEKKLPVKTGFVPEAEIPFRGAPHILRCFPGGQKRGIAEVKDGVIYIAGDLAHFSRRTQDFLISEARRVLTERTREKAALLGKTVKAVRLCDPKTRWGSCHPDGRISYSWRLILAPDRVLDYVVAHEVSHLLHKGHQRAFWACCADLTQEMKESKIWLKKNGVQLLSFCK